ncbi:hypothetical protein MMC14_000001 [Varicellaria rhodocarpa]|nr:hypothetical protein [Varicellaria rhodocarpa]
MGSGLDYCLVEMDPAWTDLDPVINNRGAPGNLAIRSHPTSNWARPSPDPNPISSTPFVLLQRGTELEEEL